MCMPSNSFSIRGVLILLVFAGLLLASAGCAIYSTTIIDEEIVTNPKPMYSYTSLIIRDFELKQELYADSAATANSPRDLKYAKLPGELSKNIYRYVLSHHTYKNISYDGKPDASTLVLTGKFTRLGRFKISVAVSLRDGASNQEVAYFRQTLWDVMDAADSINGIAREVADFINRIQYK